MTILSPSSGLPERGLIHGRLAYRPVVEPGNLRGWKTPPGPGRTSLLGAGELHVHGATGPVQEHGRPAAEGGYLPGELVLVG